MLTEKVNGELSAKISEDIGNMMLANISLMTADVKQAIVDRAEGEEFGEISGSVKFSIGSRDLEAFGYDLNLEWGRTKKTKAETVHGEYDPNQIPLPFKEDETPLAKPKKFKIKKETGEYITSYANEAGVK